MANLRRSEEAEVDDAEMKMYAGEKEPRRNEDQLSEASPRPNSE